MLSYTALLHAQLISQYSPSSAFPTLYYFTWSCLEVAAVCFSLQCLLIFHLFLISFSLFLFQKIMQLHLLCYLCLLFFDLFSILFLFLPFAFYHFLHFYFCSKSFQKLILFFFNIIFYLLELHFVSACIYKAKDSFLNLKILI